MSQGSPLASNPKWMTWVGWILTLLPVPLLVLSGLDKVRLSPDVVEGFKAMGWSSDVAMLLAVLEWGSLVLYLIPQTAVLGAILLSGYLGGACATHIRIGDYAHCWVPVAMAAVCWLSLFFRDPRVRAIVPWRTSLD